MTEEEHCSTCNNENEEFYLKLKSEAEDVLQKVCSCLYVCVCVCVSISEREREKGIIFLTLFQTKSCYCAIILKIISKIHIQFFFSTIQNNVQGTRNGFFATRKYSITRHTKFRGGCCTYSL